MFQEQQLQTFLDQLASKASTPGGGSAAAIMAAMGAALVSMVANLTVGKQKYRDVEEEMQGFLEQSEEMRARLTGMIQADIDVFDKVMTAYGMARETDAEKAAEVRGDPGSPERGDRRTACLCATLCADVIELCRPVAEKGNLNVISDAGVAVLAAHAALAQRGLERLYQHRRHQG